MLELRLAPEGSPRPSFRPMTPTDLAIASRDNLAAAPANSEKRTLAASPFAVDCMSLCKRYGRRWALVDVGFRLPAGGTLLVAGRNGSGKSTLFRVLSSALAPDRGSATVGGHPLTDREGVRRATALLGHYSFTYDSLTALENLQIAARVLNYDASAHALESLLARVGLEKRASEPVAGFSAGMRKRLALARVLLQRAPVVLLDEPYGQLDPSGFRLMDAVIAELKAAGTTILLATHLLQRGAELSDFALVLREGRVDWSGVAAELPLDIIGGGEDEQ